MAEDKAEGEVQVTSSDSSVEEGGFSNGLDSQISTIEDELKRAQATLFDLQNLKVKLEAERQANEHKADKEKEVIESEKIRRENERLRNELKEYHSEIGSLKDIISSLKDDLVKTADRLESKVSKSLNSLEKIDKEQPVHHATHHHSHTVYHHKKSETEEREHNFFTDHLAPQEVKPHYEDNNQAANDNQPEQQVAEEATEKQAESIETQTAAGDQTAHSEVAQTAAPESAPPAASAAASQPEAAAGVTPSPESQVPNAPVAENSNQSPSPQPADSQSAAPADSPKSNLIENFLKEGEQSENQEEVAAVITKIESNQALNNQNAEELLDEDFAEYEEIKKELAALEGENLFKPGVADENPGSSDLTQKASVQVAETPKSADKKGLFSRLKIASRLKKEKPQQNIQSSEQAPQPEASQQPEVVAPPEKIIPAQTFQAEEQKPAEATMAEDAKEEGKKDENIKEQVEKAAATANFKNIFKHKKPKVRGHIDGDDRNHRDKGKPSATGRLAVGAAVVLLIATAATLTYKIKNAEALRQTYTSKATEAVMAGNQNFNNSSVPDQFSNNDPEKKYKEAFVDAPFDQTVWQTYTDPEVGISIDYPQNTSYRLKPVGSNNIWFLRKNGYLLKIEKFQTGKSLGETADEISKDIKYQRENMVVRGRTTIHMVLDEDLPVKGNIYLTQGDDQAIYKIWYKTFENGQDADDQQRVQKMLDSLFFISNFNS